MILLEDDVLCRWGALVHRVDVAYIIVVKRIVDDPFVGNLDTIATEMPELTKAWLNIFSQPSNYRVEMRARVRENIFGALGVITEQAVVQRGGHFGVRAEGKEAPLGKVE